MLLCWLLNTIKSVVYLQVFSSAAQYIGKWGSHCMCVHKVGWQEIKFFNMLSVTILWWWPWPRACWMSAAASIASPLYPRLDFPYIQVPTLLLICLLVVMYEQTLNVHTHNIYMFVISYLLLSITSPHVYSCFDWTLSSLNGVGVSMLHVLLFWVHKHTSCLHVCIMCNLGCTSVQPRLRHCVYVAIWIG